MARFKIKWMALFVVAQGEEKPSLVLSKVENFCISYGRVGRYEEKRDVVDAPKFTKFQII